MPGAKWARIFRMDAARSLAVTEAFSTDASSFDSVLTILLISRFIAGSLGSGGWSAVLLGSPGIEPQ